MATDIGGNAEVHYNNDFYPKTIRLERGYTNGLTPEDLYDREAAWALKAAGVTDGQLTFGPDESILDIAVGTGGHAMVMSDRLQHNVPITGIDSADVLIEKAKAKAINRTGGGIREKLQFLVGDMGNITAIAKSTNGRYKLMTILGQSFIFFNKRKRAAAFKSMHENLLPGGKLVLGFRSGLKEGRDSLELKEARQHLQIAQEEQTVQVGGKAHVTKDTQTGEGFYQYNVDAQHPDPEDTDEYTEQYDEEGKRCYMDRDDIPYFAFGRRYIDTDGQEQNLGATNANYFLSKDNFANIKKEMEAAGFTDIRLEEDNAPMGNQKNVAIVGTKM